MRKTDQISQQPCRRDERIFREDDRWFVRTREGLRGPFSSRRGAEAEADLFVDTVKYLEQSGAALPHGVDPGDITVVDMDKPTWG